MYRGFIGWLLILLAISPLGIAIELPADWQRQKAERLTQKETLETELQKVSLQEESLLRELQKLDQALAEEQKKLRNYEAEMASNQTQLEKLYNEILALNEANERYNRRAANRIRGIYKLRYQGRAFHMVNLLLNSGGLSQSINRYQYLRSIMAADQRLIDEIVRQHASKQRRQRQLTEQRQKLHVASQTVRRSKEEIARKREQRRQLLERCRQDKEQYDKAIRELEEQIGKLEQRLGQLSSETSNASGARERGISPGDLGKLPWPVVGRQIANLNKASQGITIRAPAGTDIRAVADGVVRQVDWVLGFGNVMILDHGDAYFSIYAHVSETLVDKGTSVTQGQVIAKVGETGSLIGPILYFELWKSQTPLDTQKWLKRKAD